MATHKAELLETPDLVRGIKLRIPCLTNVDVARIRAHIEHDQFFWLDLDNPSAEDVRRLGDLLEFHPLAIEDTLQFGQRPKLDDYDSYAFMVFYGMREEHARREDPLCEVHMFLSGKFLVTVHRVPLPVLDEQRTKMDGRVIHSEQFVFYRVLDALTDTFFPPLSTMDDEIDELEDGIIAQPSDEQLQRIFALKRDLVAMRKVIPGESPATAIRWTGPEAIRARL